MPHYVKDVDHPGAMIDVILLQRRHPTVVLEPELIYAWLKRDLWTRREAILLLSGYNPNSTEWSETAEGFGQYPRGNLGYLDCMTEMQLRFNELQHPLYNACIENMDNLRFYAQGQSLEAKRAPSAWLEWAASKDFVPYWLLWIKGPGQTVPEGQNGLAQTGASISLGGTESSTTDSKPYKNTREWYALNAIAELEKSGTRAIEITADLLLQKLIPLVGKGNLFCAADDQGKWIEWKTEDVAKPKKWYASAITEWLARRGYGPRQTTKAAKPRAKKAKHPR